jgi:hypothetical protein
VSSLYIPDISDHFMLVVQTEQLKRPCHIVWRKEKRMGVAFDQRAAGLSLQIQIEFQFQAIRLRSN